MRTQESEEKRERNAREGRENIYNWRQISQLALYFPYLMFKITSTEQLHARSPCSSLSYTLKRVPCTFLCLAFKFTDLCFSCIRILGASRAPPRLRWRFSRFLLCLSVLALLYNCFVPLLVLTYHPRPPVTEYLIFCVSLPFVSVRSSKIHKSNTIVFFQPALSAFRLT